MRAVRCVVRGRVQGVGFRRFVEHEAGALGLVGWVSNRADGSVETYAEGALGALTSFVEALGRGPMRARVDEVDVDWREGAGEYRAFRVR